MQPEPLHRIAISLCLTLSLTASSVEAQPHTGQQVSLPGAQPLISANRTVDIYRHLVEMHWVPKTGLFLSFPDSLDRKLSQQASVYEQGAVGLLAVRLGDFERARGIFDFLKAMWESEAQRSDRSGIRGLANFYNGEFGNGGIEKTIHLGPNAWAGLFAARLANASKDAEALQWSLDVAYWIANKLPHENGAVAMGPRNDVGGAPWTKIYSTENNLSYYAMLTELLRSTKIDANQRAMLTSERDRLENWLVNSAFDRSTYRVRRGANAGGSDPIQALDTITWFVSAIGPKRLAARGIDLDRLMQGAAKTYEVSVNGRLGVDPSDQKEADFVFNHAKDAAGKAGRPAADGHRIIWYEGLGQYILALSSVAEYLHQKGEKAKAREYLEKAKKLTEAFDAAALKNYRPGSAFPYATPGKFFRDGWQTQAEGKDGPASSLIAATWRCFAGLGTDPVAGRDLATVKSVQVSLPKKITVAERRPAVLFGTSEDMVVNAWRALRDKNLEQAIEQAQATIQEWAPSAKKLQERKMRVVGKLIDYSGTEDEKRAIFSYWALNDVASAYFILAKAYDEKREYTLAAEALQQIVHHYPLAQVWDPNGWFWAPVDAVSTDFVQRDPEHYASVMPQVVAAGSSFGKRPN
jgi:tetratricopeptide (TPR) repeat protein